MIKKNIDNKMNLEVCSSSIKEIIVSITAELNNKQLKQLKQRLNNLNINFFFLPKTEIWRVTRVDWDDFYNAVIGFAEENGFNVNLTYLRE